MKFTLTIELGNDAMQTPEDVAEVLAKLGNGLPTLLGDSFTVNDSYLLRDVNGNRVGGWSVTA